MKVIGIIPARMASTRFPGKPLCKMCGMTMVEHVYRRSAMCKILDELYVATCDREIKDEVERFGGLAVMTKDTHKTCSDRVAEACINIKSDADVVVNIQGDEPLIYPQMIEDGVKPFFKDKSLVCTNVISKIDNDRDFNSPNFIKVVKDLSNYALYFSREPIPSAKKHPGSFDRYRQVCILPFRRDFLLKFVELKPSPTECVESVDMVRVLEYGYKIKLVETEIKTMAVDNEDDRKRVEKALLNDGLFKKYKPGVK
ncbi:MAG: 3-deoxy-manno-octulosonate cytidylyltransferase [Candidatus Omnitrophota bacterium]